MGTSQKLILSIIGTEYWSHGQHPCLTLVRPQLFPALIMVSLTMTAKPLMLSVGCVTSGQAPKRCYNILLMLVEVDFERVLHRCIAFANGNRAIDAVICPLTVFGGRVEADGRQFFLYIPRGREGLDDFRWSIAHTGLDPISLSWLDLINEKH